MSRAKRGFRIAGGILTILGSCLCTITGTSGLTYCIGFSMFTHGVFACIAFAYGLTAGILTLTRKVLPLAITGESFVIAAGILACIPAPMQFSPNYMSFWPFGLPILILSSLGLIFTAVAREDFGSSS